MKIQTQALIDAIIARIPSVLTGVESYNERLASLIVSQRGLTGTVSFRCDYDMVARFESGEYDNDIKDAWLIVMDIPVNVQIREMIRSGAGDAIADSWYEDL